MYELVKICCICISLIISETTLNIKHYTSLEPIPPQKPIVKIFHSNYHNLRMPLTYLPNRTDFLLLCHFSIRPDFTESRPRSYTTVEV